MIVPQRYNKKVIIKIKKNILEEIKTRLSIETVNIINNVLKC